MNIAWGNVNAGRQSVLDTALDAVVVMGDDGVIIGWNSSAERMFGWTAAEAIGQLLSSTIVPQVHRKNHENGLSHYLQTGEGPVLGKRIEVPARRRDGSEIPVELSINATERSARECMSASCAIFRTAMRLPSASSGSSRSPSIG